MDLTGVLSELYDWLADRQQATIKNSADACKAKVPLIASQHGKLRDPKGGGDNRAAAIRHSRDLPGVMDNLG